MGIGKGSLGKGESQRKCSETWHGQRIERRPERIVEDEI